MTYQRRKSDGHLYCVFAGDIGTEQEEAILSSGVLKSELLSRSPEDAWMLKAAHHGSNNSNCREWLQALSPDVVLISAGKNSRYHHPGKETVARMDELGLSYLCTMDTGEITIRWEDGTLQVEQFIQ